MLSESCQRFTTGAKLVLAVALAGVFSCTDSAGPETPEATGLWVTPSTVRLTALADTVRLTADVRDQNGHVMDGAAVAWSSSDVSVAAVDGGLVRATGNGTATVTAASGQASGSAEVAVSQEASAVEVTPTAAAPLAAVGDTVRLAAAAVDANGHPVAGAVFAWSSDDEAVAAVDSAGLVTAVGNGTATVTAASGQASGSAEVAVSQEASAVEVTPTAAAPLAAVGDTVRLAAAAVDANGHPVAGAVFAWSSDDEAVAAVDSAGLVTAVGNGTATVTAASGQASGSAEVAVSQEASAVEVTPTAAAPLAAVGDTVRLAAAAVDANGHPVAGAVFAWSSDDEAVAAVDSAGLVTAVGNGTATVTAASGQASGSAEVAVSQEAASLEVVSGDGQHGDIGDMLPDTVVVRVMDAAGAAAESIAVSFTPTPGHGTADPGSALSDAEGLARTIWTLGSQEGEQTLTAAAGGASVSVTAVAGNPDRAALVALYNAAGGPNWVSNANWLTAAPLGEWRGVSVDGTGRVATLYLHENNLVGTIPPELGDLASLRQLVLSANALSGPIPPELGSLASLQWLYLHNNALDGPIPPELGSLASLQWLYLYNNALSGTIPPELGSLAGLQTLSLSFNALDGPIPPELGSLASLERLSLHNNALDGPIPPELGSLAGLQTLSLSFNALDGPIPPELGSLASLERMDLANNALDGPIPPELGSLASLQWLFLSFNALDGPIPPELGSLASLQTLSLSRNALSGTIPPELGSLASLQTLYLHNNALDGPIPPELGSLASLEELYLSRNAGLCVPGTELFGIFVASLKRSSVSWCNEADAAVLEALYASASGEGWENEAGWLDGTVLADWHGVTADSLGRVTALDLADNGLAGVLPAGLGELARLREMRLGRNPLLSGRLPASLSRLSLNVLDYAGTTLCAPVEAAFRAWLAGIGTHAGTTDCARLSDRGALEALYSATGGQGWANNTNWLTDKPLGDWHGVRTDSRGRVMGLSLYNNALSGTIPPELGSLAGLQWLSLSRNALSGTIPPELGSLASLQQLSLSGNALSGTIPPELGSLAGLQQLWLSSNALDGPIPPELGSLAGLEYLGLSFNALEGPIPPELGSLAGLQQLSLSGNALSGTIPPELGSLAGLQRLWLSSNALDGPIPPELGSLAGLVYLDLTGNALEGPIPPELGSLAGLVYLDLTGNALEGPIPPELGSLASLEEMYLTHNAALAGALPAALTGLRALDVFEAGGTGLCAPSDPVFLEWLGEVRNSRVRKCAGAVAAYMTQAVQSRDFPVPLVAGEEALLRVFVTASDPGGATLPPVRARFYLWGAQRVAEIPATPHPIPEEVDEGTLSASANAKLPGHFVQPGLELVIEVDPEGTLDPALGAAKRIPAEGRLAVDVREMPVFDLTVIPFLWSEDPDSAIIAQVEGMSADPQNHELLRQTADLLPVGGWSVTAHAPVLTSSNSGYDVLRETSAIRVMEGGAGHYMGMLPRFSDVGGVARISGRASASVLLSNVIAHELGHNFSLRHAPCGGAGGPDPIFPDRRGGIAAWGYAVRKLVNWSYRWGSGQGFAAGRMVPPGIPDVMSYCGNPEWISEYHFTKALEYRIQDEAPAAAVTAAAPVRSLLLWGGVDSTGTPSLEPAFVVDAPPSLPERGGEWSIEGRDADGTVLFALPFAMPPVADAGEGAGGFAFALPVRPGWEALADLTLSGPDETATLDGSTDRPMSVWRDGNGQVRAVLRGPPVQADGAPPGGLAGFRVIVSRGIPAPEAWRR